MLFLAVRRIRITVSYDGTDFHGWQVQPGFSTVQQILEETLATLEGKAVSVAGSGRTDAGVHALAQVAAFSLENPIPVENLRRAMNRLLPPSIRILQAEETHESFHPRFDAIGKTYEYRIFRAEVCDPFLWRYVYHYPYPLDVNRMTEIAPMLEGEHDFHAFASADRARDAVGASHIRRIFSSRFESSGPVLIYRVRGSGFLKHMVRNIVGFLLETGKGNADENILAKLLHSENRQKAGTSVPAKGLTLCQVEYEAKPF